MKSSLRKLRGLSLGKHGAKDKLGAAYYGQKKKKQPPLPPASLDELVQASQEHAGAGEIPIAFVVRANGVEISEQEIKNFVAEKVMFYKKVHKIYFVDAIPKSASGKILRMNLKARL